MPKFDYTNMPYEPKQSTGERVPTNAFYNPNPDYKESEDIYTGYHTYSYSGVTYWEHDEADDTKQTIEENIKKDVEE